MNIGERKKIVVACHRDATSGHMGTIKTLARITERFMCCQFVMSVSELAGRSAQRLLSFTQNPLYYLASSQNRLYWPAHSIHTWLSLHPHSERLLHQVCPSFPNAVETCPRSCWCSFKVCISFNLAMYIAIAVIGHAWLYIATFILLPTLNLCVAFHEVWITKSDNLRPRWRVQQWSGQWADGVDGDRSSADTLPSTGEYCDCHT